MEKTIALTGAEIKVEYGGGANAWLRNDGTATIYAAKSAGITAGADGVLSIPAGQSASVYGTNGTVYLLGTGSIMLVGSDYSTSPFKSVGAGGGTDIANTAAETAAREGLPGGVPFSDITISGKNLLPYPYRSKSGIVNGVTFTVNDDGSVTVSGTATENANFYLCYDKQLNFPTGKYTMSGCPTGGSLTTYRMEAYAYDDSNVCIYTAKDIGSGMTLDLTDNLHFGIRLSVFAGTAVDTLTFKPQLERGNMATAYEPPITGREVTLAVSGKNMLPPPSWEGSAKTSNGVTFSVAENGTITISGTTTGNTTVHLMSTRMRVTKPLTLASNGTLSGIALVFKLTKDGEVIYRTVYGKSVIEAGVIIEDIYLQQQKSGVEVSGEISPQLEFGESATAYEPYHGSTVTVTPDSAPYTVPNDIRQQDGINNVMVSAGTVQVTGVRHDAALKRVWDKLDELTTAIIVSNGD